MFDYGAPIGFRLASSHPEQVTAIVSQYVNAYQKGLLSTWDPIRKYWEDPSQENREALRGLLKVETTRFQYTHGVPESMNELISPDAIDGNPGYAKMLNVVFYFQISILGELLIHSEDQALTFSSIFTSSSIFSKTFPA